MLARFGVSLSRSTLCDWPRGARALLRPPWELLRARVQRSRQLIQTDEHARRVQAQAVAARPPGPPVGAGGRCGPSGAGLIL